MKKYFILAAIVLPLVVNAQENFCGTQTGEEQLSWLREFQQNYNPSDMRGGDVYYVPLKIHVVGNDEGTGFLNANIIIQNMCDLNAQFEPTGFVFYLDGDLDYISNSSYYSHDFYTGYNMMAAHNVSGAVNLYYVDDPAGNCGYFSYAGDAVAIAKSCGNIGNSTIAHELGHFFSLPHTFYGWEYGTPSTSDQENVDGSNCESAGDGFCDTPPDYASYRWNCSGPPEFTDPTGATFFPDGTNMMSYADDPCMVQFKEDQQAAMQANLTGPRNYLLSGDDPVYMDLDSATLVSPIAGTENLFSNYTELKWNAIPNAKFYELSISLNTGFNALAYNRLISDTSIILTELSAEKKYYWRIRPVGDMNYCESYSDYWDFSTGYQLMADIDANENNYTALTIYPNPAESGNMLNVSFVSEKFIAGNISIIDFTGKTVYSQDVNGNNGINTFSIHLPTLSAGVFVLMLKDSTGLISTQKFVLN